jgi:hypothetical protein
VNTEDIDNLPLSGTFNVVDGLAQIQFEVKESAEDKTIVFSIPSLSASVSIEVGGTLYDFTTATFTNGSQEGRLGPSLTQARSGLSGPEVDVWKNDTEFFNTTDGIQLWTVPKDGTYRIEAWGAQGGGRASQLSGGLGARMRGDFQLTRGDVIQILVGQMGIPNPTTFCCNGSGGGGGTFVVNDPYDTNASILVIAGGGGGDDTSSSTVVIDANTTTDGAAGQGGQPGGTNGNGGATGSSSGGGGGFFTDGGVNVTGEGGISFISGGLGGQRNQDGGFGGGGAAGGGAGGGGGYSGGGGGATSGLGDAGGGGGSFNSGTNQSNSVENSGHGKVEITFIG